MLGSSGWGAVSESERSIAIPDKWAEGFSRLSRVALLEINNLAQNMVWPVNCCHPHRPNYAYRFTDWRL